ncbi:MAG: helix-turn-helix domain-containing protein [Methanosphaera sp.]|uniref:helix-turn-helix domain-containing protein n=1 Tax=Methanosphaera sp. TaxID=2666342 RepID=UPI0025CBCC3F|nr:helix-turn-helix domain-containing protein [Methanosphaera sp.]MCI5867678.1 helix-turn-helix domain-containing protein [Methanosphaera sp.]MDD6534146.1 helix-turn-helix domain-containing protein [Methanosphaera sp.]MDY3956045.1 helix-turn-helix domain-containing protein [Methanosphaera sp.]
MSSKIHVNKPLTSRLIIELLDSNPDLEEIECPQSLYERTSETYLDALSELGISISTIEQRGRPRKYDEDIKEQINSMIDDGFNPNAIAKRLHIDVKTVYYLKDKKLKQGPKSKYSDETKAEIISLREDNVSVKEISALLNIPVRTIYYILKHTKSDGD